MGLCLQGPCHVLAGVGYHAAEVGIAPEKNRH